MQTATDQIPEPDGEQGVETENSEQRGFSDTTANERNEPVTGETNDRDPAWRPGDEPPGEGVYDNSQEKSTGVEDEPQGPAT